MGSASGAAGALRISVEVRSVNHRFFSPVLKLPAAFSKWEGELRERMRAKVNRGYVTLSMQVEREASAAPAIDESRFGTYLSQLKELSARHGLAAVDVSTVLRLPGVIGAGSEQEMTAELSAVMPLVDSALNALDVMRIDEGKRMGDFVRHRLVLFGEALQRIEARAPGRLVAQHARLRESVASLAKGVAVDEQRLAQEIAVLADKIDIAEEIGRLRSHLVAFTATLDGKSEEPHGKRLGFLLQEMLREVNTIGSKGADVEILRDVVLLKEELERIREQAENIE